MPQIRERIITSLGEEIQCAKCGEFWPSDDEFYFMRRGKPHSWCKACYRSDPSVLAKVERWKQKQRVIKPAKGLRAYTPPPAPPSFNFGLLAQAMRGALELS